MRIARMANREIADSSSLIAEVAISVAQIQKKAG
jgi:hypothetical protein